MKGGHRGSETPLAMIIGSEFNTIGLKIDQLFDVY